MKISDFKSGKLVAQYQYKSFSPNKVNHEWSLDDDMVVSLLSKANIALGKLSGFANQIPNVDYFIKMHIYKEATCSSEIEGTQTKLEEILQKKENIALEKRDDWEEVHNYIKAMNFALDELKRLPLCNRLLRETHKILMQGVRGETKQPGEFRTSQNWIGGRNPSEAMFVPPYHTEVQDLMGDIEMFLQNDEIMVPSLIKIAIAHYQFETIHPFLDGNGRMGRLLITLFLINEKILDTPTLYLSSYLAKHRTTYFDFLMLCREKNNLVQWLKFFLSGVIDTAEVAINTLGKIIDLKTDVDKNRMTKISRARMEVSLKVMDHLYGNPIVTIPELADSLGLHFDTTKNVIYGFMKCGILYEMTGKKRNKVFYFKDYLSLFEKNHDENQL